MDTPSPSGTASYVPDAPGSSPPPPRPALLRLVVRHNPAYLFSALLMVAGIAAIVRPSQQPVGHLTAVLATFSTLEVYELLLVAIAIFLVCFRRVMDDGATVVLIESLFVVGCFMILDEIALNYQRIQLGLALGLLAAVIAMARFAVLGRSIRDLLPLPLFGALVILFLWNGIFPSAISQAIRDENAARDPACVVAWWIPALILVVCAVLASRERDVLWPTQTPFLASRLARWCILGMVVLATGVHHYSIAWTLDTRFRLGDVLPFVTAFCAVSVILLAATRRHVGILEHAILGLPTLTGLVAACTSNFRMPFTIAPGHVPWELGPIAGWSSALTWPPVWLGLAAVLGALHAWRRRSTLLTHQAAVTALLALLAFGGLSSHTMADPFRPLFLALTLYLFASAAIHRSAVLATAFATMVNLEICAAFPEHPVAGIGFSLGPVILVSAGISCFLLWLFFQERFPRWLPHLGAILAMAGVVSINFLSSTQCPPWLMATISGGFALIAAAVAWTFHWRSYYVLALIGLSLAPKHPAEHAPATAASPGGWLLILASFVVLGLAVLISHWKARESSAVRSEP